MEKTWKATTEFRQIRLHICFFVDYSSMAWYSFGCAVVYHAYAFDAFFFNTLYSKLFLWLAAMASIFCVTLACLSRFMHNIRLRKGARVAAFVVPYTLTSFPLLERIFHCEFSSFCSDASIWRHERQFFFAFLYSFHFPECLSPGSFDIANYDQMWACFTDLKERRGFMADRTASPHGMFSVLLTVVVLSGQLLVVGMFTYVLIKKIKRASPSEQEITVNLTKTK